MTDVTALGHFERPAWTAEILLIAAWAAARIHSAVLSRRDLQRFAAAGRAIGQDAEAPNRLL